VASRKTATTAARPTILQQAAADALCRNATLRLEYALSRSWEFVKLVGRPNWPTHKFAAAIRTAAVQDGISASAPERAFKRANHRVRRVWQKIAIATLAVRPEEQHGCSIVRYGSDFILWSSVSPVDLWVQWPGRPVCSAGLDAAPGWVQH